MRAMNNNLNSLLVALVSLTLLITACQSPRKLNENGNYDDAVSLCVRKLKGKKNKKDKFVRELETAFQKAQNRDLARIKKLTEENRPEYWKEINHLHRTIGSRQEKIAPLLPLNSKSGYRAKIDLLDIDKLETDSRSKAAAYQYNEAKNLVTRGEQGDLLAARAAYAKLVELENNYYQVYQDKELLKAKALDLGTAKILFEISNKSDKILPGIFNERLTNIGKNDLDSPWKSYYFAQEPNTFYHYKAIFKIQNIEISPEKVAENRYTDESLMEDGWEYVLDSRGNVKKDSLGNDIKKIKMSRITADVLEIIQTKAVRLAGRVEYYDTLKGTLLDTRELGTEIVFENYASTFKGNEKALSKQTKSRLGNRPLPFPTDLDMLNQAADKLKPALRDELRRNNVLIK